MRRRRWSRLPALRGVRPRLDLSCLLLLLLIALAAPLIARGLGLDGPLVRDPRAVDLFGNPTGPGAAHPLGVDDAGRDVLSRILYGLRSLALISLAASALAGAASVSLAGLARLTPWLGWLGVRLIAAIRGYPALLLGLALAASLSGVWRLIVPMALGGLLPLSTRPGARALAGAWATALSRGLGIDVGLTFLGLGPGGRSPQLGAMIAQAGRGVLAGVPAWWALVFPGLALAVGLVAAQSLACGLAPGRVAGNGDDLSRPRGRLAGHPILDQLASRLVQLIFTVGLAAAAFAGLGGAGPHGVSALAGIGADLGASGSLLLGGLVVWGLAVWLHLRWVTRAHAGRLIPTSRPRIVRALSAAPAALLGAAPPGWLAFLALYAFSDSVGKLAILPGAGSYVGLGHDAGHWAESLVMPWLVLGLLAAAWTILAIDRPVAVTAGSQQQRVARAAGVPEPTLAQQRRRALWAPLLARVEAILPSFVGVALIIEVTDRIPGVGAALLAGFDTGATATVSDLTLLVTVVLIGVSLALDSLASLADPRAARR